MDFNQLLSKMQEIDSTPATEAVTDECGMNEMPPMAPPMPAPEKDKARMNINISAEGDAIDDVLKLMTKVNPDMMPKEPEPMPTLSIAPPMGPKPINKLIPDFDADNDDKIGGEKDMEIPAILDKGDDNDYDDDGKLDRHEKDHDEEEKLHKSVDRDNDGDHDMDDHKKESVFDEGGMSDKAIEIEDWAKKYEKYIGNNGDTLPEGYVKYFMDSGIFSDAYDQDETAKAEKMIGKPYTEWDYDDQEKALEMMPTTKAMFDEIEKITGTSGEDAAEMVAGVLDNMEEAYANQPDEDFKDIEYLIKKLAGGMNRPKGTHPKVADGDNPMQTMEAEEQVEESKCEDCGCDPCECDDEAKNESNLRAQIRAELAQRLAEAKGEK